MRRKTVVNEGIFFCHCVAHTGRRGIFGPVIFGGVNSVSRFDQNHRLCALVARQFDQIGPGLEPSIRLSC